MLRNLKIKYRILVTDKIVAVKIFFKNNFLIFFY